VVGDVEPLDPRRPAVTGPAGDWPAREDLPSPPPSESEESRRAFSHGTGVVGFGCTVLAMVLFFAPFLDVLLAVGGIVFSSRSLFLARTQEGRLPMGVPLALAGVILGVLVLVPAILITSGAVKWGPLPPP
jgi:hypothetical protein